MFILAVTFSIGMVVSIWLITGESLPLEIYIKYGVIGAIVGLWGGWHLADILSANKKAFS